MIEVISRRNAGNVLPVMWTIGELDIDYVQHDIGGSFGGMKISEHLARNPSDRIPFMIRDDGFVLWEPNAIVRYLCRRYDKNGCLLPRSEEDCALADQWMDWCKTTLHPPYIALTWSIAGTEPIVQDSARMRHLRTATEETLAMLNYHLHKCSHILGDYLSMADIPFGALYFRYLNLEINRPEFKGIDTWYRRLCQRPAFIEHVMASIPK